MTEKMAFWAEETLSFDKKEKLSSVLRRYASYLLICQFALQPVLAQAQMVPDQSDPSKAPTIDSAPNGVPVVNITRPSASGVSQNRFTEFNVDAQGVILNNSASHGTSQLGGVLLANPNLGGQEARIIVNEVTGSNASQLRGFTEIFGGQAQYVLSNSNGIYCNGCGFINTPRATLTTGQAQYNDGNLTGLDVENSSQIDIDGLGLNAQDIAALDLVARSVRVNAPVNAQDLRVFTGRNLMDYGARTVTVKADDGSAKPALALDGALFGGMYARRIEVIATEDGVGVKMPDDLAAGTGDITITADGGIALKNLSAKTGTTLSSANGDINITGGANGGSSLSLSASNGAVATDAAAVAGALDTVTVTARSVSNNGRIVAGLDANANGTANGDLQITASQDLNNGGTLTAGQDLTAQAADITSTGLIQAGNINSLTVANNATLANLSAGTRAEITATNGNVTVNETVNGGGETVITATNGTVATGADGVIAALDRVTVDAANITNQGEISAGIDSDGNATATGALTLKASQKLTNSHYITSGDSLTVQADEIDNDEGYLLSVGAMTLEGTEGARATAVVNQSGTIETATGDILIRADALSNKRKQFTTGSVKIFDRSYSETSGNPPSNPPGAGISGAGWAYLTDGSTVVVPHPDRGMAYASYYDFGPIRVRQYEVQVTATSAASMLSSGNNLTVDGGTITNEYSAISAKGDIALTGTSLQNTQVNLTKDLYFTGPNGNYNRCVGGPCQWFGNGGGTILVERSTYDTVSATIQAGGSLTGSFTGQINNTTISQTVDDTNLQRSNTITSETPYKPSKLTLNPLDIAEEIPGGREILEEIRNFNGNEASVERRAKFADLGTYFAGEDFLARVPGAAAAREISDKLALGRNAEKTLIDGTIVVETGKRWLDPSVRDSEGQMKQLVDNAVEAAGNLQLAFGVSLSAVQIQALTKNIVWYEEQEINGHKVLLPKIYLASTTGSVINDKGTLAAGSDIRLDAGTTLANSGNIEAGNTITLTAQDDLVNSGGRIQSGGDLSLEAVNGDLVNQTETYDLRTKANEIQTVARTKGELISGGDLTLKAGNDVTVKGAAITALGDAAIEAGNNVEIGTIALRDKKESVFEGGHDKSDRTTVEGSSILVDGALSITAGEDLTVRGSAVAAGGDLALKAGDDLTITSDQNTATYDTSRSKKSFWKSSSLQANGLQIEQQSSVIGAGGTLSLEAGDNARITASAVNAGSDLSIKANDVLVDTARDVKEDFLETKRSGFFVEGSASGDGVGFSAGARKEQHKFDTDSATQVVSGLNSGGAITIEATQDAVIDSATLSAAGDVNVRAGNDIDLKASSDTFSHSEEHKIKQAGISVSLKQNVTQAVESVANLPQALTEGEGGAAAQGVTAASAVLKVASAVTALQKGAVSAEVSFGVSSSEESSSLETETARVAEIHAGRDVNLTAGDDITAEGTRILGGRDVNLEAGDELTLESAQDHFASSSQSSSKSASVGASVGVGFTGYTASASGSVSSSDSDREETRTTQSNAQVAAGRDVTIKTGGDTTLKGARVAAGEDISAEIGGDLLVESVQDTGRIDGSSSGSSVGLGIGLGGSDFGSDGGGGQTADAGGDEPSLLDRTSLNSSSSMGRESGEKAWVNQQTGLVAGGDVEINVGGHTQVNGGIIASTGGDVTLSTETFAHRHLRDVDNYEQKNISISGSTNLGSLFGGDDNGGGTGGTGGNAGNGASGADGEESSLLDIIAKLPTVEGGLQSSEKEQATRATVAAPNGKTNIVIRANPDQGLDGINTAIEKAQELIRDEKTTVKVFVSGESLAEVVSGFEQTRKMISTAADKVEAIADYLDRQMEVLPKSMENKGEAMKKAFRLMTDSGIDPEQAYQLLDSPLGKLIQIQAYLDEIGSAEDFNNLPVEERNELIDLMGANIKLAGLEKVSGLTVELQNIREQAGLKLLQFYRDGFNSAADFLSENEDGVNASLSVLDILPGAMWALAGMGEGTLEVVNPVTNGEHRSNESMIEYYAEEFETGVKRVVNAKEGIDEKSEEFQAFLFETALKQLREADISGEDAALAGTIIGAATIAKLASKRLTAGGKGSEAKKLAKDIKALASEIDRKILEHDALKSFDLNLARIEVTTVRSGLTSKLKRSGNVATAKIKIDGIPEKMNAHSQIEPYNITEKMKDMGLVPGGSGNFTAKDIENAVGDKIPRHVDSEYKILDNIADQLGGNYTARGSVTIFTERPACGSCLSVADQFVQKYPNIVVVIKDNKGNLLNPNRKED